MFVVGHALTKTMPHTCLTLLILEHAESSFIMFAHRGAGAGKGEEGYCGCRFGTRIASHNLLH